ncbi:CCL5 protein, partial [Oceanites oceanicus]|nr:CCL5 protein [Oceanites oceanicus]
VIHIHVVSPSGHMDSVLHPKSRPAVPDTAVCCFTCIWQKLSREHVKDYFYTTSRCQQPAVVFITRKKHQVCAEPDAVWVKAFVNFLGTH